MSLPVRASLVWLAILVFAILNGAFRQALLIPKLGEEPGHIISTLLLSAIVFLVTSFTLVWIHPLSIGDAWFVGITWTGLTLAFEFLAGHYLFGNSWKQLLADYNVARGRIWVLVPIVTLVSPVLVYRLRLP